MRPIRVTLLTLATAIGLGTSPALADSPGFTLALGGPPSALVGQAVTLQATGANPPPGTITYLSWLSAVVFRPSNVPSCPASSGAANQMAPATGGAIITLAQREDMDINGRFSVPVGLTPLVTGPLLICAYSSNEEGGTWATASFVLNVKSAAPASVAAPRATRSGKRFVCRPGTWANAPTRLAYRWLVDRRPGAQGSRLRITRALRGHRVQCSVTASNDGGSATAVSRQVRVR